METSGQEASKICGAMQKEVVIGKIGKHFSVPDLLALRQTCKMWNGAFISWLRVKHSTIKLQSAHAGAGQWGGGRCLHHYTELMNRSLHIPFGAYNLSDANSDHQSMVEFFEVCGSAILTLTLLFSTAEMYIGTLRCGLRQHLCNLAELELCAVGCGPAGACGLNSRLPELPNLKRLVFGSWQLDIVYHDLLTDIITATANLEELQVTNFGFNQTAVAAIQNADKLQKLDLQRLGAPEIKILICLAENSLQLQIFAFTIPRLGSGDESLQLLHDFLSTQSKTLARLELEYYENKQTTTAAVSIPKMDKLRDFVFRGRHLASDLSVDEGNLRDNFPKLRKLSLVGFEGEGLIGDGDLGFLAVEHPGVSALTCNVNDLNNGRVGTWLPGVTDAEIKAVSSTSLPDDWGSVWTEWPALESLSIHYEEDEGPWDANQFGNVLNLDEIISGVPSSSHGALQDEMRSHHPMALHDLREMLGRYKTNPGISDLHHLRNFTMKIQLDHESPDYIWTDIGACFGFAVASPSLQHVQIIGWRVMDARPIRDVISEHCRVLIREALGPDAVVDF